MNIDIEWFNNKIFLTGNFLFCKNKLDFYIDKSVLNNVLQNTKPWNENDVEDICESLYETEKIISDAIGKPRPTFEEVLDNRKKELKL